MAAPGSWAALPAANDMTLLDVESLDPAACAAHQAIEDLIDVLAEPGGGRRLALDADPASGRHPLRFHEGRPLLLPDFVCARLDGDRLRIDLADAGDPALQYIYLNMVKNSGGDHNTPLSDPWYRRHLHRSRELVRNAEGLVLDVGCDNPALSRLLFPSAVRYFGIDPGLGSRPEPCLVGMAEFLPVASGTLDGVAFLTSLDHVFDYHTALDEAFRVLRPGGKLFLASLVWTHRAELIRDNIHFHHFRQHEIEGALSAFRIEQLTRYNWKGDEHRFGVYLVATKP